MNNIADEQPNLPPVTFTTDFVKWVASVKGASVLNRDLANNLLEAREEVERLRAAHGALCLDVANAMPYLPAGRGSLKDAAMDLEMERAEVRAEVERLRALHHRVLDELDEIAATVPGDAAGPHFGVAEWLKKVLAENERLRARVELLERAARGVLTAGWTGDPYPALRAALDAAKEVGRG